MSRGKTKAKKIYEGKYWPSWDGGKYHLGRVGYGFRTDILTTVMTLRLFFYHDMHRRLKLF